LGGLGKNWAKLTVIGSLAPITAIVKFDKHLPSGTGLVPNWRNHRGKLAVKSFNC
jgi:hypothetical protein